VGHDGDPFGSYLAEISRRNAEAIYTGATGEDLDADTTITEGHKHDTGPSRVEWCQLGSWAPCSDTEDNNREGLYVTATSQTDYLMVPIYWPMDGASPVFSRLRTRVRVSNPATSYSTYTTLYLAASFYRSGDSLVSLTPISPWALAIQSLSTRTYSNEWVAGPDIELSVSDLDTADGVIWMALSASVTTAGDKATLHEIQGAWR
jgi:hypothetical protein